MYNKKIKDFRIFMQYIRVGCDNGCNKKKES